MPRAEVGSTKYLSNKLKSKGLQRLRWYCQVCERQMRDENGFKMHTQSESHVRQMLIVGEDPKKFINSFSNQFQRDFLLLLRTAHGEKQVHINHFYQEYISNKEHIHMNATRWPSLTEFAKYLGREGICRVEETDKGIHISWIDNSPDALRRQDAIRKKERQDRGDEERERLLIQEQVEKAKRDAEERAGSEDEEVEKQLKRGEGKLKLKFSAIFPIAKPYSSSTSPGPNESEPLPAPAEEMKTAMNSEPDTEYKSTENIVQEIATSTANAGPPEGKLSKVDIRNKPKNVFAIAKKNALAGKKSLAIEQPKKVTEAERIMKEEIERKRNREAFSHGGSIQKRMRL